MPAQSPIHQIAGPRYDKLIDAQQYQEFTFDGNGSVGSVFSPYLPGGGCSSLTFKIAQTSGTWSAARLRVVASLDGTDWFELGFTDLQPSGAGPWKFGPYAIRGYPYYSLKLTTAEGSALSLGVTGYVDTVNAPINIIRYASGRQTLTSAGALTLTHGLGGMPDVTRLYLECVAAELNYTIGDKIIVEVRGGSNRGFACIVTATDYSIRFGSDANLYNIPDKTTGVSAIITNASWKLHVEALRIVA